MEKTHQISLICSLVLLCRTTPVDAQNSSSSLNFIRESLRGVPFRASAYNYPPAFYSVKGGKDNVTYKGFAVDVVQWMAERYKFKLVFVPASQAAMAKHGFGGLGEALMEQLLNDEVDLIPWAIAPNPFNAKMIDFTIYLRVTDFILLQRWPDEESRLTATIHPFTYQVWLVFLISTLVLISAMSVMEWVRLHQQQNSYTMGRTMNNQLIYVISVVTGQGNNVSPKTALFFRFMVGLWCLMMVVVVNAYTGTLTSRLAAPKLQPIIHNLQELAAASPRVRLTVDANSAIANEILNATAGPKKILGDQLRRDPKLQLQSFTQGIENIMKSSCAYPVLKEMFSFLVSSDLKTHGYCRLTTSPTLRIFRSYSFGLPKNGLYTKVFNTDLQYLWENGLLDYWVKQYIPELKRCRIDDEGSKQQSTKIAAFTLIDLSSVFLVLGFGLGLSFVSFAVEMGLTRHHATSSSQVKGITKITSFK